MASPSGFSDSNGLGLAAVASSVELAAQVDVLAVGLLQGGAQTFQFLNDPGLPCQSRDSHGVSTRTISATAWSTSRLSIERMRGSLPGPSSSAKPVFLGSSCPTAVVRACPELSG